MEGQTQEILSDILGSEFKLEVEKRDKIIKQLNSKKESLENEISLLGKQLEDLNIKKSGLNEEINLAYSRREKDFLKEKSDFEQSKSNVISSLDSREKDLNDKLSSHESNVKSHQDNISTLSQERSEFEMKKKSIADTLEEAGNAHSNLFKDAVDAIRNVEIVPVVKKDPVVENKPMELLEQE